MSKRVYVAIAVSMLVIGISAIIFAAVAAKRNRKDRNTANASTSSSSSSSSQSGLGAGGSSSQEQEQSTPSPSVVVLSNQPSMMMTDLLNDTSTTLTTETPTLSPAYYLSSDFPTITFGPTTTTTYDEEVVAGTEPSPPTTTTDETITGSPTPSPSAKPSVAPVVDDDDDDDEDVPVFPTQDPTSSTIEPTTESTMTITMTRTTINDGNNDGPSASPTPEPSSSSTPEPSMIVAQPSSFPTVIPSSSATTKQPTNMPTSTPSEGASTGAPSQLPTAPRTVASTTEPTAFESPSTSTTTVVSEPATLFDCLRDIVGLDDMVVASDAEYDAAKACLVYPPDAMIAPMAVVKTNTSEQVASVVRCSARFAATVSARSGAHSFVAESCRGQVILDMSLHEDVHVDPGSNLVTFGAGQHHGNVYGRLLDYGLGISGGTEVMVGVGGLWLGCGRGLLTQAYGYSCDSLKSIEYVNADGDVAIADETSNVDMFWLARGGGGLFPGIVTKFTATPFAVPDIVYKESCYYGPDLAKAVLQSYVQYLDETNDPARKMFSALIIERPHVKIELSCFSCNEAELNALFSLKEEMLQLVDQYANMQIERACFPLSHTYAENLIDHAEWDTYETIDDLFVRPEWPEWQDFSGADLSGSAYNGAVLVPDGYVFDDDILNEIVTYLALLPGTFEERKYADYFAIYPAKGRGADDVDPLSTAFGARGSIAVIHYKMGKVDDDPIKYKQHMDNFESALVDKHGLPCRGFYNYQDEDLACATNDDEWLAAFYSDPQRVRSIVSSQDPDGVFYRLRLQ